MDRFSALVRCPSCDAVQSGALSVCLDCGGRLAEEPAVGGMARLRTALVAAASRLGGGGNVFPTAPDKDA